MARPLSQTLFLSSLPFSQTLIRSSIPFLPALTSRDRLCLVFSRKNSTQPKLKSDLVDSSSSELEAMAVRNIEDAIHGIVVRKSTPDWLPFLPGASFWVPPKRRIDGLAEIVHKIAYSSPLSDDEAMSLVTFSGWPSFDFFIHDASIHQPEGETSSRPSPSFNDED